MPYIKPSPKPTPNKSVSVVSKSTASDSLLTRLKKTLVSIGGVSSNNQTVDKAVNAYTGPKTTPQKMPSRGDVLRERAAKSKWKEGCHFNLHPHAWSLPVRPISVIGEEHIYGYPAVTSDGIHKDRRGAIWWYSTGAEVGTTDDTGQVTSASKSKEDAMTEEERKKAEEISKNSDGESKDFNYGFQFLWNPEQLSVAVARNMDITPSSADRLRSVSGAFPGQESVTFSVVLDRVNDFAAIRSIVGGKKTEKGAYPSFSQEFLNQYKYGLSDSIALGRIPMNQKLYDLSRYGTMADLEYLFKAINGAGPGSGWVTLLGKKTADIGFLSPTLLAFRFGPDVQESLSFVGWITNLSISHTMFTEEMIPIRTTVNFSVDCFAGSSII